MPSVVGSQSGFVQVTASARYPQQVIACVDPESQVCWLALVGGGGDAIAVLSPVRSTCGHCVVVLCPHSRTLSRISRRRGGDASGRSVRLSSPRGWAEDRARRAAAGVPEEVEFATEPALATAMMTRGVRAGLPAGWVSDDEVYGSDPGLRAQLETLGVGYVLGIGCNRRVTVHGARGGVRMRVDQIAADRPAGGSRKLRRF